MASQTDLAPLQGAWRIVALEADGWRSPAAGGDVQVVSIEGNEWVSASPRGITRIRFALDPARHRLDFLITLGVVTPGIYCLDGDKLLVCTNHRALRRALGRRVDADEVTAPPSFAAPCGSCFRLWELERVD